jgi:hypothetical protein
MTDPQAKNTDPQRYTLQKRDIRMIANGTVEICRSYIDRKPAKDSSGRFLGYLRENLRFARLLSRQLGLGQIRKNTLQDMTDPQAEKYRSSSIHSRKGQIRNDT